MHKRVIGDCESCGQEFEQPWPKDWDHWAGDTVENALHTACERCRQAYKERGPHTYLHVGAAFANRLPVETIRGMERCKYVKMMSADKQG